MTGGDRNFRATNAARFMTPHYPVAARAATYGDGLTEDERLEGRGRLTNRHS